MAMPAHADHTVVTGYNNGDVGVISLTASAVGGARSTNPLSAALDAKCEFHQVTRPSSNETQLIVMGHAAAAPDGANRVVSIQVTCVLKNHFTGAVVVNHTQANEGSVAAWVPPHVTLNTPATSYRVCAEAKAHYFNGNFITTDPLTCLNPF
ncbi:MAG TPA: hypothetical protein VNA20_00385 [Frankiaceae bacterium]|nr:hypothetical protein [Frankiaceae bacterium]